jgi:hypothetical protein
VRRTPRGVAPAPRPASSGGAPASLETAARERRLEAASRGRIRCRACRRLAVSVDVQEKIRRATSADEQQERHARGDQPAEWDSRREQLVGERALPVLVVAPSLDGDACVGFRRITALAGAFGRPLLPARLRQGMQALGRLAERGEASRNVSATEESAFEIARSAS